MKILKYVVIFLILISLVSFFLNRYIAKVILPRGAEVLHSYAETNMFEILNSAISEVIEKYSNKNQDIVTVNYLDNGMIGSINIDYNTANKIKSEVSLLVSKRLSEQDEMPVKVHLGDFVKNMYFTGKGPVLKFVMVQRGFVQTDFEHEFQSAGINQTIYTLKLSLDADVALMIPFYDTHTRMKTSAILSQTIINGDTPEQIVRYAQGGEKND